jgi:hypothetical protein
VTRAMHFSNFFFTEKDSDKDDEMEWVKVEKLLKHKSDFIILQIDVEKVYTFLLSQNLSHSRWNDDDVFSVECMKNTPIDGKDHGECKKKSF